MKEILLTLIAILTLATCTKTEKQYKIISKKEVKKEIFTEKLQSIEVEIKGMTCEIGCARLIQSNLYKFDGVTYANINFEDKKGKITYNSNKIDKDDIKNKIEKIAGGNLYFVTKINNLDLIIKKSN